MCLFMNYFSSSLYFQDIVIYLCILAGVLALSLSLFLSLSFALSVGGSRPRITVSVVEVARPEQHRERGCCRGLGQGLLWASRFSWLGSRSLAKKPLWSACGCEDTQSQSCHPVGQKDGNSKLLSRIFSI